MQERDAAARDLVLRYDTESGYMGYTIERGRPLFNVSLYDRVVIVRSGGSRASTIPLTKCTSISISCTAPWRSRDRSSPSPTAISKATPASSAAPWTAAGSTALRTRAGRLLAPGLHAGARSGDRAGRRGCRGREDIGQDADVESGEDGQDADAGGGEERREILKADEFPIRSHRARGDRIERTGIAGVEFVIGNDQSTSNQ